MSTIRNRWIAAAAVLGVGVLAASVFAAAGAPPQSSDDAKVRILRLDAEWSEAAAARDVDKTISYVSDDAVVFPPGRPAMSGKAAIREYVVKSFQIPGFRISWKTTTIEVSSGGDLAYGTGTNRISFLGPDGKAVIVDGKAVTVWRREAGGDWKCVVDIWNETPAPASTP